jgi:hypothetical protein
MFCPDCHTRYSEELLECPACQVPLIASDIASGPLEGDLDVLIKTNFKGPVAIGLAKSLLQEAGIPFFAMDQNLAARQESGNLFGWWNVRVPRERQAEAHEILDSLEETSLARE